jgi:hypothetical protein
MRILGSGASKRADVEEEGGIVDYYGTYNEIGVRERSKLGQKWGEREPTVSKDLRSSPLFSLFYL